MTSQNLIVVIYDGQCRFCKASVDWVKQKLHLTAIPFQQTELHQFGLTYDQVSKSVHVIVESQTYSSSTAVAYLLKRRGNRFIAVLITASGPLGRRGYHWIAANRNGKIVKIVTKLLERSNSKYKFRNLGGG